VLDRNSLQIIDLSAEPLDVEEASGEEVQAQQDVKEELDTFEAPWIEVSTQNDTKNPINAEETSLEKVSYQKNLQNVMKSIEAEEVEGLGKITFVETNCKETPASFKENEGRALNAGTEYKELLCASVAKISMQQGMKEPLDVEEVNREDISRQHDVQDNRLGKSEGQGKSKQRLKHYGGGKMNKSVLHWMMKLNGKMYQD
jgi:hypothetical protein